MVSIWQILVPILAAVIPVAATIITGLIFNPPPEKAFVTIEKDYDWFWPDDQDVIKIKNIGGVPATNITGLVESNSTIKTVSLDSVVNLTLSNLTNPLLLKDSPRTIEATSFEFNIPKLIQGDGGYTEIKLKFDKPQGYGGLKVVAIYDQGSAVGKDWWDSWRGYVWLMLGAIAIGEIAFSLYLVLIFLKKRKVKSVCLNFLDIRRRLIHEPEYSGSFIRGWRSYPHKYHGYKPEYWKDAVTSSSKYLIVSDLLKVDFVFYVIWKREVKLGLQQDHTLDSEQEHKLHSEQEHKLDSAEVRIVNYEVLRSINDALSGIDWKQYT
jgi:hypothetical protein